MVAIEELGEKAAEPAQREPAPEEAPAAAIAVSGAGLDDVNGLYMPTGRTWHRVPVFENDRRCLLSREPHRSRKTGQNAYGWILGQDGRPLYAVQSARIAPPASGWRKFQGTPPAPEVQAFAGPAEAEAAAAAAACAAKGLKERGNALFGARDFEGAEACWTRAIDLGDRLQDEELCVALLANRAQVRLRRKKWREARSDAEAALARFPSHDKALYRAAVAAREMGCYADAADFAERCLKAHPGHPDAESLLAGVRKMEAEEAPRRPQGKAPAQEAGTGRDQPAGASIEQPDLGPRSTTPEEKPPLHELPYHKMGLPKEQVEMMDKFFGDMRMQKETAARAKSAEEGAQPQGKSLSEARAESRATLERELAKEAAERKERLEQAEREAHEAVAGAKNWRKGEPSRFEQAASEVYAWWELTPDIRGSDCKVRCSQGGQWLTVAVRGVAIFDAELFQPVRGADTLWEVLDGTLHVTLTKAEHNKLWEQLQKVPEVVKDERGQALPETIPEPLSGAERVKLFQNLLDGDDGLPPNYDSLDRQTKQLVDAMRRHRSAKARGDESALAMAEMDLDEFGRFTI